MIVLDRTRLIGRLRTFSKLLKYKGFYFSAPKFYGGATKVLQKRGNIFYFRWVLPTHIRSILNQRELYQSLQTCDRYLAKYRAAPYYQFVYLIKGLPTDMLTKDQLQHIVESAYRKLKLSRSYLLMRDEYIDFDLANSYEYERSSLISDYWNPYAEDFDIDIKDAYGFRDPEKEREQVEEFGKAFEYHMSCWDDVFTDCGVDRHQYSHQDQNRILRELLKLKCDDLSQRYDILTGRQVNFQREPSLPECLSNDKSYRPSSPRLKLQKSGQVSQSKSSLSGLKLSIAFEQFLEFKRDLSPKMVNDYTRNFKVLLEIVGDIDCAQITKNLLKDTLGKIATLPTRNRKPYNKISLTELLELAESGEIPEEYLIADNMVKNHLRLWQSMFSTYLTNECDVYPVSPTNGIRFSVNSKANRYANLSNTEILSVFSKSKASEDHWWYMLCRLAAYTGARKGELFNLKANDFKIDSDTGRLYFFIQSGKTEAARRKVPIASCILSEVKDYIGSLSGDQKLFPNPTKENTLHRLKSYFDEPANDYGQRKVFHSIRHTFITKAQGNGIKTELVQAVVGHEQSQTGITARYTHHFELKSLLTVVDSIRYEID